MLDWDKENGDPKQAKAVIKELELLLVLFDDHFSDSNKADILKTTSTLTQFIIEDETDDRSGNNHRLTKYSNTSPLYSSMDPDPRFGKRLEPQDSISCERVARFILLFDFLNIKDRSLRHLSVTQEKKLASLCRNYRHHESHTEHNPKFMEHKLFKEAINNKDWDAALVCCEELKKEDSIFATHIESLYSPLKNISGPVPKKSIDYTNFSKSLKERPSLYSQRNFERLNKKHKNDAEYYPTASFMSFFEKNEATLDTRLPEPFIHLDPLSEENEGTKYGGTLIPCLKTNNLDDSRELRFALAVRGNHLQMISMYSGQAINSLIPREAKNCMEWLLTFAPTSNAENIAKLLWVLQGISGFRFDNLLLGFTSIKSQNNPLPDLSCSLRDQRIEVTHNHIIDKKLPFEDPLLSESFSRDAEITILIPDSLIDFRPINKLSRITKEDCLIKDILQAKKNIKQAIRSSVCDRFTENRWRSSIIQQVFNNCQDLPLLQFVYGEAFNTSTAALHYIAWEQRYISKIILESQHQLYNFPNTLSTNTDKTLGTPRADLPIDHIKERIHALISKLNKQPESTQSFYKKIEYHNILVDHVGLLLGFCTANRNNDDFHTMTLDQLSLHAKLAVFEDKQSDPAILRRASALSDYVVGEIQRYIDNLIILADHARKHTTCDAIHSIKEYIALVLNGEASFFFKVSGLNLSNQTFEDTSIEKWYGRQVFTKHFGDDINVNSFRHIASTWMRRLTDVTPLFIETQLGHIPGYPLFNSDSVVSPIEFSEYMNKSLTHYLAFLGYPVENRYETRYHLHSTQANKNRIKSPKWHCLSKYSRETAERDIEAIRKLRAKNTDSSAKDINTQQTITQVLSRKYGINGQDSPLKSDIRISKDEADSIYKEVLTKSAHKVSSLEKVAKLLRTRLKQLKDRKNWDITLPAHSAWRIKPPIPLSKVHLIAYDELIRLRSTLSKSCSKTATHTGDLALLFMVFGGSTNIQETYEIFTHADSYISNKTRGYWLIDIHQPIKASRTVSGIPLLALHQYLSRNVNKNTPESLADFTKGITRSLPENWMPSTSKKSTKRSNIHWKEAAKYLEDLLIYGRYLELPPILHAAATQQLISRELTSERLFQWLQHTGNNAILTDQKMNNGTPIPTVIQLQNPHSKALHYEKRELWKKISAKPTSAQRTSTTSRPVRRAKSAAREVMSNPESSPLVALLANWAEILLSDHANLKTEGKLATKTVGDYLSVVADILIPIYSNRSLESIDEDDLIFCIEETLSESPLVRNDQAERLTRFFYEIPSEWGLPKIVIGTRSSSLPAELSIDAGVLTDPEIDLTYQQIQQWSQDPSLSQETQESLIQCAAFFKATANLGTRRSELQYLKQRDLITEDDNLFSIKLRFNQKRTLKTSAAERIVRTKIDPIDQDTPAPNDFVFPKLTQNNKQSELFSTIHHAMRHATGDINSHLHHLRHSKGTRNFEIIFAENNLRARVKKSCQLTREIGHTKLSTTATHYAHNLHHIISTKYAVSVDSVPQKFLSVLTGKKPSYISKVFKEEKSPNQKSQRLSHPLSKNNQHTRYNKEHISTPHSLRGCTLSPSQIINNLYMIITNKQSLSSRHKAIASVENDRLLEALISAQENHRWECVSSDHLKKSISSHSHGKLKALKNTRPPKRRIDESLVKHWFNHIATLDQTQITDIALALNFHLPYIDFSRKKIEWGLPPASKKGVKNSLSAIGIPIELVDEGSICNIQLDASDTQIKNSVTTTKTLLLMLICLTRITLESPIRH